MSLGFRVYLTRDLDEFVLQAIIADEKWTSVTTNFDVIIADEKWTSVTTNFDEQDRANAQAKPQLPEVSKVYKQVQRKLLDAKKTCQRNLNAA